MPRWMYTVSFSRLFNLSLLGNGETKLRLQNLTCFKAIFILRIILALFFFFKEFHTIIIKKFCILYLFCFVLFFVFLSYIIIDVARLQAHIHTYTYCWCLHEYYGFSRVVCECVFVCLFMFRETRASLISCNNNKYCITHIDDESRKINIILC